MKLFIRSGALLLTALAVLSGCTAHCNCPPPEPAQPSSTTIIHERPSDDY